MILETSLKKNKRSGEMSTTSEAPTKGEVEVSIVTVDGPEMISTGGGAIKITAGGIRINTYENEAEISWSGWAPEFVGDFLALDLPALLEIGQQLYTGAIERDHTVDYLLEGHRSYFVFEPVSEETVRVAFQTRDQIDSSLAVPDPTPRSERGYVVNTEELCQSLLQCAQEFQQQATAFGVARDGLSDQISEVESVLTTT
ncbi:hypothetical protein [Halogeometricum borinquense]